MCLFHKYNTKKVELFCETLGKRSTSFKGAFWEQCNVKMNPENANICENVNFWQIAKQLTTALH